MADLSGIMGFVTVVGIFFLFVMGAMSLVKMFYFKVPQGTALIVNNLSSIPAVSFTGAMVLPVIYKRELMRISLITLEVDRRGKDGLICMDNMRADITVAFYLRVNETREDVLKVAKSLGADRASDKDSVNQLFNAKFSEALKTVGKQFDFVRLFEDRQQFREKIIEVIGDDLNGYVLEDVAIDYLEQTAKSSLDPSNILDAEGIKKITEITAEQNIRTNILERDEQLAIKKKDVATIESILELEKQQKDAEARQAREVANIQAREEAETLKVSEEERRKAELARLETEQDIQVRDENKNREIEVAEQNRQRAVAIEEEKVTRARDLEIVSREREVELQRIEAEKAVEIEKKEIANVIRERVVVDKTVAIEEERIKEVREVSEADRAKQVVVLAAEAEAQEELVKEVKAAEADEQKAKHKAVEINTLAQADLEAAGKKADADKKLAEGTQATQAAPGIAEATVQEAKADALQKEGLAEARVQEAKADSMQKEGLAEAKVLEEKLTAEATGAKRMGDAEASAKREVGLAGAEVIREQFKAEADGLSDKFEAMSTMDEKTKSHEEFRMSLEKAFEEAIAAIDANKDIAKENADVLATALQKANIDIVGGEGDFFEAFAKSLHIGKAVDGAVNKSPTLKAIIEKALGKGVGEIAEGIKSAEASDA